MTGSCLIFLCYSVLMGGVVAAPKNIAVFLLYGKTVI